MDVGFWIALGSIATSLIVIINLYIIFVLPCLKKPKFSIEFLAEEPFCRTTDASPIDDKQRITDTATIASYKTYWIRLRIRNSGKSVARRCIGKLVKIFDEGGQEMKIFDPTQLHWVGTDWEDVPFRTIDLDRNDYEYIDALVTQEGTGDVYIAGDQFTWAKYQQRGIINSLPIGKYILVITIYGDDVEPETKYLSLTWGGVDIYDIQVKLNNSLK